MRKYSITNYKENAQENFKFLETKYGYTLSIEEHIFSYLLIYTSIEFDLRINLNYDKKDNFFYFNLIKSAQKEFSYDLNNENIKPLFRLVQKYEPNFDVRILQPDDQQYLEALKLNAEMLKKYGDKVLKGEEWF